MTIGRKNYFTGVPCKHGHVSLRATRNSLCLECNRLRLRAAAAKDPVGTAARRSKRYFDNIEKVKATQKRYREANKEAESERQKMWVKNNPDKELAKQRKWRAANLEKARAKARNWHRNNPVKSNMISAARRARIKRAVASIPEGMQEVFNMEIRDYYAGAKKLTKKTGIEHDVDHILPLSKNGVHAPWNMRVVTSSENRSRQNKIIEEEPIFTYWHGLLVSRLHNTVSTR